MSAFTGSLLAELAFGGTCLTLLLIAALSSWILARRAAAIDPLEALRRD